MPTPSGPPHPVPPDPEPEARPGLSGTQRWLLGGIAAVVLVAIVAVVVLAGRDDDGDEASTTTTTTETTTTTTEATTTTTEATTTTTTTFAPVTDPFEVAFPSPEASRSFEDPVPAARAYATEVLGFEDVVTQPPEPTPSDTEVLVQPFEGGPETRIELIELDDAWYVLGSTTPDIFVDQPVPGASLASPFETMGEALAFEGTVQVLVLSQDDPVPLGNGVVTGSGTPPPGPFAGDIAFSPPPEPTPGILVYRTSSAEDGRVLQAASFRVRLTGLSGS